MSSPFGALTATVIMTAEGDILTGSFDLGDGRTWPIDEGVAEGNEISFRLDRDGSPMVYDMSATVEGDKAVSDIDSAAGESVSFTAAATDSDGTIESTQWLVDGVEVATGLSATLSLPNGSTVVTFKATDDDGASSITTATITVASPAYEPTVE